MAHPCEGMRHPLEKKGVLLNYLAPGIFGCVGKALGLVVSDILNTQVLKDLVESLAVMTEGHGTVVGIALLDQHMAVEAAHLGDGEDADAAKAAGLDGQDLALGDVGAEVALAVALEAVEGDIRRAISPSSVPRVKSGSEPAGSSRRC